MGAEGELHVRKGRILGPGLRNVLRRENRRWWSPRSLLWLLLLWTVLANGPIFVLGLSVPHPATGAPAVNESAESGKITDPATIQNILVGIFCLFGGLAIVLGAIIRGHDSVLKERESGTAAWMISKPVSRSAFILAKMIANGLGLLLTVVLVQGLITYALISLFLGRSPAAATYFTGLAILGLFCLFFMVLAVSLSTLVMSRGITLGLPLLFAMGGLLLAVLCRYAGIMPSAIIQLNVLSPANLSLIAWNVIGGASLAGPDLSTVIASVLWIAGLIAAALVKFERAEL